jgi:hypothetical protein
MNTITLINATANTLMAISSASFIIFAFGRPSKLWEMSPVQAWLAKAGLSATCAGCVLNILTLSTPQWTEVLLNCGLALTCAWANWWHWTDHLKEEKPPKKAAPKIKAAPNPLRKRRPL